MTPRLGDATHVGAVRLQVADAGRSLDFYRGLLGFAELGRAGGVISLGVPESSRPLVQLVERPGTRAIRPHGHLGLYHFAILLPDREALGRALLHLHRHRVPLGMADHLVSEALYLSDPDGLGIEIYRDRPRAEWRFAGGTVAMASDPLDIEGIAASAGGAAWTGMPARTVIGHVHLHVGDLTAAEAFYADALGFDVTARNYPGALFLSAGGYHHHLGTNTWARGARAPAPDDAQLLHWDLVVADGNEQAAVQARLRAAGVVVVPGEDGTFVVRDPFGTPLRVVAQG
ncbi:MAG TPA: VOC family protein [Gemmatimonadaceae bacterium]|nr:VOC family protein [Gemmatimonadaceae bacterium]